MKKIAIYGIGNFGYALLKHLDKYKSDEYKIYAYDRKESLLNHLVREREHLIFHKGIKISSKINFVSDIKELISDADVVILAVTSVAIKEVLLKIKPYLKNNVIVVNTAKALDSEDMTFSNLFEKVIGEHGTYAMMAGGSIAKDLFHHEPLGIDIACKNNDAALVLKDLFKSENVKIYLLKDVVGVELASAFKNVVSIFAGIVSGLGMSFGSETHYISRFSKEIQDISVKWGADKETFNMERQCWGNDLWMSCLGNTRNREFGFFLGSGKSVLEAKEIMKNENKTVEGLSTILILDKITQDDRKDYLLLSSTIDIVLKNDNPDEVFRKISQFNL